MSPLPGRLVHGCGDAQGPARCVPAAGTAGGLALRAARLRAGRADRCGDRRRAGLRQGQRSAVLVVRPAVWRRCGVGGGDGAGEVALHRDGRGPQVGRAGPAAARRAPDRGRTAASAVHAEPVPAGSLPQPLRQRGAAGRRSLRAAQGRRRAGSGATGQAVRAGRGGFEGGKVPHRLRSGPAAHHERPPARSQGAGTEEHRRSRAAAQPRPPARPTPAAGVAVAGRPDRR